MKMLKFGNKNVLFGYFRARIGKKLLSYLKSAPSNLPNCRFCRTAKLPKFCEKTKMSKFGTKMRDLGIFGTEFSKNYCHIWNQHLRIWLVEKQKMSKFGTKSALFGYFWTRILKILLSYLKSASSNLFSWKTKNV